MTPAALDLIAGRVRTMFPRVEDRQSDNAQRYLVVPREEILAVARYLLDQTDLAFDSLSDLTGYDLATLPSAERGDAIAVVLLLHSFTHRHRIELLVLVPHADCRMPSLSSVWPAAIYFEREVFDLLGVHFDGHPSLRRIMLPDDWVGHPLRKDYRYPSSYAGVAHLREGQRFEGGPRFADATESPKTPGAPA